MLQYCVIFNLMVLSRFYDILQYCYCRIFIILCYYLIFIIMVLSRFYDILHARLNLFKKMEVYEA
jgi:hypothetical protein